MNTGIGSDYDFNSEENASKWKGLLTAALKKVLEQVHPSLGARDEALEYVESLCLRLLGMLCAKPSPHTVQDVESRVQNTFPTPIDKWALKEAQEALDRGKKKSVLLLPVDKIHNLMQKELLSYKVDSTVSLFLVAVLEYISADILKLVGNYAKNIKHVEITYQDVQISMKVDKALMDMFYQDEGGGNLTERMNEMLVSAAPRTSLTYEETVRELIASEKAYLKELHMIIKVFREEIKKLTKDPRDIELIFSNIMDIYELTYTLTGSLEDVMEMAQEQMPYIGSCFEELAEAKEFDVYCKYGRDVTSPLCRQTLLELLSRQQAALNTAGQGMPLALKYYLPALLTHPIWHFFSYMDYIRLLIRLSPAPEDKEMLTEVEGMLKPLRDELTHCVPSQSIPRSCATLNQAKTRRSAAIEKVQELQRIVENWDSKDLGQCCNEFVREDVLTKVSQKRLTDRRVFLFDGLMVLCKPTASSRRQSSVHFTSHPECRLKERFFMRKVEIKDHDDTDEIKHAFEILPRQMPSVMLCAKSFEDKNSWMADLVMLNNRSMLERVLDSILSQIEQQHPLKLPPPELYKFAEPDSTENIILEQRENGGGVPLIKGATLYKLVERLTYHIYADPKFVRTFLTTYRSFCSPITLLELLIERFHIPDPSKVYEQDPSDTDKIQKSNQREDWKKYRKEYCQPVQFRVLNVLRHWVDQHFYDFERDPELLAKLEYFLDSDTGQNMKKWVESVKKTIKRKKENDNQRHKNVAFVDKKPPQIEWHLNCNEKTYGILTLHPLEIARQLTIIEFDLYRMIKPSELVGSVWTKKDKELTSPNLLKMIKHTTNFTRWLEKNIVEAENFDERVAIVNRICEILMALNEMNNFNGVLAISSATQSAAVHRLKFTFQAITQQYRKVLDECKVDDHFKKYQEKLRSINPPCVPFLGMYLSNILHIEEGNPDYLPGTQLINFFKRRKVAEITGEIQQYQNQPYCLQVEPQIRNFLENLNPFEDMLDTDIQNYLYQKSMEIEPRGCRQLPKVPRKWPLLNLKSPGIKPKRNAGSVVANAVNTMSSTIKSDDSKSEDSSKSDNDNSIFASVQVGTGQNSPTVSPNSPAAPSNSFINWISHSRSPSVSSTISTIASYRPARSSESGSSHLSYRHTHSTSSTGAPGSPGGPHTPTSPGPHLPSIEPNSPRLSPTPPPPPPPLPPRKRRDSPEISSPQQVKQAATAPPLPPKDQSPPPLPPRREPGPSPNQYGVFHSHTLPHPSHWSHLPLRPTHASQLHMRRHAHMVPRTARDQISSANGGTILPPSTSPAKPPTISPRYGSNSTSESSSGQITPQLPPRPAVRSAGFAHGTMFQYPNTTTT